MASLAHSAALAAVGARPGAGAARPPAAPPRPRARTAATFARPCAPSAARRCVIPAISRALRRLRARRLTLRLGKPSSASPRRRWGWRAGGATTIPRPPRAPSPARTAPIADPRGLSRSRRPLSPPSWACASPRRSPGAPPPQRPIRVTSRADAKARKALQRKSAGGSIASRDTVKCDCERAKVFFFSVFVKKNGVVRSGVASLSLSNDHPKGSRL